MMTLVSNVTPYLEAILPFLKVFKLFSICTKFQGNQFHFFIQKKYSTSNSPLLTLLTIMSSKYVGVKDFVQKTEPYFAFILGRHLILRYYVFCVAGGLCVKPWGSRESLTTANIIWQE